MDKLKIIKALLLMFVGCTYAGMGDVLTSWQAPLYNDVNGIAFEGNDIWLNNSASETKGVFKCTKAGSVIKEMGFPYHGWGPACALAFDGEYLWTIFWPPVGPGVIYDHFVKYTTNGSVVFHFAVHPDILYNSSVSVSWDGQYLWTDGRRRGQPVRAEKYTTAGSLLGSYDISQNWRTAAGYYNNQIWAGGSSGYVYGMNVGASTWVASFAAPGGSCGAVGFDGEYLWTADKNTPQYIYKVDIDVVDVNPGSFGKIKGLYR
jgi:hypothetical protein